MNAPAFAVTVLRALAGKRLVKVFSTDRQGRVLKRGSDKAAEFVLERHELTAPNDFFLLLESLGQCRDACIVRGAPGPWCPSPGRPMFRLLHPQPAYADPQGRRVSREAARRQGGIGQRLLETIWLPTLVETPTSWVLLDFEKIAGEPDWRRDLAGTAAWLKLRLPDAFADARCWYQATSSAADPSKPDLGGCEVRMRLAFVLSRPLTEGQLKAWLGGIPGLDPATFRSAQEIYVGRPIFTGGLVDPMPVRSGVLDGLEDIVQVPVIEAPRWSGREAVIGCGSVRSAEGLGLLNSPRLDAALERLAEAGGAAGGVRSGLMGAALAYVADVGRERVDIDALAESLTDAAAPYRSAAEIAGYNIASMISWALERAPDDPPPRPHYPDAGLPADEAIARLRQEMAVAIGAAVAWRAGSISADGKIEVNLSPPVVGIKAGAGLGKTGAALEQIAAVPGIEQMNIEIFVPDHRLAQELAERVRAVAASRQPPHGSGIDTNAELRVLVIRGRGAAGTDGAAMCDKAPLAEEIGKAGLNVMSHLCKLKGENGQPDQECEFAASCRYLAQFRDNASAIRILPHAAMFVRRNKAMPDPDLIVIDESFWRDAIAHKRLALDRLTEVGRWRSRPRKGESPFKAADRLLEAEDFARRVRSALEDGRDPRTVVTPEESGIVAGVEWGSRTGPGITPGMAHKAQVAAWQSWKRDECAKAGRFWNLLQEEHAHPDRPIQRIVLERDATTPDGDRRHLLHLHHRRELTLPTVPVLLLDADLDPRIIGKFWTDVRMVEIPVRQQAEIVQVCDRSCSMCFMLGGRDGDQPRADNRLAEVEGVAARTLADGGLIVSYKAALERMKLPPGADALHLGNMRGRDGYKHHDVAVVAGRLEPGVGELERMTRAMFGDEAEPIVTVAIGEHGGTRYPVERRRYRMADGAAGQAVTVSVHPDHRAQSLLEQVRERELEQAVARLRLVHRVRPATVYLLTNVPLNLEIATVTTWNALTRDREGEACRRWQGVWLCSAGQRSQAAPELWPSRGAEKQARRRKGGTESSKEYSRAVRTPFPTYPGWRLIARHHAAVTLIEYRYPGQRGSPHPALVPGDVWREEAARANLEAVTGPVTTVTIIGIMRREQPSMIESRDQPSLLAVAFVDLVPVALPPITDMFEINGRSIISSAPGRHRGARRHRPILPPHLVASMPSSGLWSGSAEVERTSALPVEVPGPRSGSVPGMPISSTSYASGEPM